MKTFKKKVVLVLTVLCLGCSIVQPVSTTTNIVAKTKYVYITPTGTKYHTHKCGNGTYRKVKLSKAKKRGLGKCKRCY